MEKDDGAGLAAARTIPDVAESVPASDYDKQHVPGCRKLVYDRKSSPCTCVTEYERMCGEVRIAEFDATKYRDELGRFREVANDLHEFQLRYETAAWEPGRMPGNELYSGLLMGIVGAARRALRIGCAPVTAGEASATLPSEAKRSSIQTEINARIDHVVQSQLYGIGQRLGVEKVRAIVNEVFKQAEQK